MSQDLTPQAPAGGTTSGSSTLTLQLGRKLEAAEVGGVRDVGGPPPPSPAVGEPVGAPALQSIPAAGEEDTGLEDPENLHTYVERRQGSA